MKPFRLTRRALGSAVCMTLLAGTVLFTSPTPVHAAAQGKDTLVFVNYRDLRDLNPHLYAGEMFAQEMVFEGLVTLGNDGKYHGAVAESWGHLARRPRVHLQNSPEPKVHRRPRA